MPEKYILKKDHLPSLLRKLRKEARLVAPVKTRQGDTLLAEIEAVDAVTLDLAGQAVTSVKSFLLPQQEVLFAYESTAAADYAFTPAYAARPTVYFGIRSCDLSAILYMDLVFLQVAKDPYYLLRRQAAVLISLACNEPFDNCFCNATKNGPFLEFGFDLQLTDLGDRFLVEIGRAKGKELVMKWRHFFAPATEDDRKAQYQAALEARGLFKRQVPVDLAIQKLRAGQVPAAVWADLSRRCQDCGGCAYICPTCTCFTITDLPRTAQGGERLRTWDACTYAGFSRLAGGHNPVDKRRQGVRKRFEHKLRQDVAKHGRPSCVGCGRCVDMCFGGVDIVRFIDQVCADDM